MFGAFVAYLGSHARQACSPKRDRLAKTTMEELSDLYGDVRDNDLTSVEKCKTATSYCSSIKVYNWVC